MIKITHQNPYLFPILIALTFKSFGQTAYEEDQPLNNRYPWNTQVWGPDQQAGGWYYNLGITGLRMMLDDQKPRELLIKHVWPNTPAAGKIQVNDRIIGTNNTLFQEDHRNGHGRFVFGARGPAGEFATALETAQSNAGNGNLSLMVKRGGNTLNVTLNIGKSYGAYSTTYPENCPKCSTILAELNPIIRSYQNSEGAFGNGGPDDNLFGCIALMSIGGAENMAAVKRCVQLIADETTANGWQTTGDLINWTYTVGSIILSEYYLATGEQWVKPELNEIYQTLLRTQYTDRSQIIPTDEPDEFPPPSGTAFQGGWGHNPGFEAYGPISMITAQGALGFALMQRCGIAIDRARHDAAYNFLVKATGPNDHVWYGETDDPDPNDWSANGRTGTSALAYFMANYKEASYRQRALRYSQHSGNHPQSFPDTHASPEMGMLLQALGTYTDPPSFRKLMDANKWWFALAQTPQKSFYYSPARDITEPSTDFRFSATCVAALVFSLPNKNLYISGKRIPGYDEWAATFDEHLTLLDPWGDFDGDNKTNLAEFQNGTNPISDAGVIAIDTGTLENKTFTYTRKSTPNTTFSVWYSSDLATWTQDTNANQTVTATNPDGTQNISVTLSVTPPTNTKFFIRVRTP